jgi:curli biogenesis system outer membrane secretion channel CsgG
MNKAIRILTTAWVAFALLGCASTKAFVKNPARLREIRKVAVLPFVCSNRETGFAIADGLSAQLVASNFTVIERSQFEKLLAEQKINLSGLLEEGASMTGKIKGVDAIIVGSATVDRGYAGLAHGGHRDYVATATARLIDVVSGEALIAANYSASGARTLSGVPSPADVGAELAKKLGTF